MALPLGQIVPVLADRGLFIGSERSFYRVLNAHGQAHRRGKARLPQKLRPVPRLRADGPDQVWPQSCQVIVALIGTTCLKSIYAYT